MALAMPLLQFGLAEATPEEIQSRVLLEPLTASPVVGALARRSLLGAPSDLLRVDANRRVAEFEALLSETPIDSAAWLQLATARRDAGAALERIDRALALSRSTGRFEGQLMAARASFALSMWAALPPEMRQLAITDLLNGGWGWMPPAEQGAVRSALKRASDEARVDLRARLMQRGASAGPMIRAMGLAAPSAPRTGR